MGPLMQLRLPLIVFTDSCCDINPGGKAAYGAIILDGASGTYEAFGQELPQDVVQTLSKTVVTTQNRWPN